MAKSAPSLGPLGHSPLGVVDILRAMLRGMPIVLLCLGGLVLVSALRGIEAVMPRPQPLSGRVTQGICRISLRLMHLPLTVLGTPMAQIGTQTGVVVANHASWLDIFALNVAQPVYFVAKSEVARWPFIGWLARATGTLFITRKPTEALRQQAQFTQRLCAGQRLLFFPEGTSTDSTFILPFKPTLFAALFVPELRDQMWVQPATVIYTAPQGQDARFYGWWGDMGFAPHLLITLAQAPQGRITVVLHPPLRVADYRGRKDLAAACEAAVRAGAVNPTAQ